MKHAFIYLLGSGGDIFRSMLRERKRKGQTKLQIREQLICKREAA
jgi:hypothetical protein